MRINLHMLKDCLQEWDFTGELNESYYDCRLVRPQLCVAWPDNPSEDVLYIISHDLLPDKPTAAGKTSVLCIGKPSDSFFRSSVEMLYTSNADVEPYQVMNAVSAEFALYAQWESAMKTALAQLSLQKMAKLTAQLLENPIEAWEAAVYLLCASSPKLNRECPSLDRYEKTFARHLGQVMPEEEFELLMTDEEYLESASARKPTIYSGKPHDFRTLYYNIFIGDTPVARICEAEIVRKITGKDYAIIYKFGEFAADVLTRKTPHSFLKQNRYLEVFTGLLDHRLQQESQIARFLAEREWNTDDRYVCFAMKTRIPTQHAEADLAGFAFRFADFFEATCYALHESNLVFMFNLSKARKGREEVYRQAVPLLRDNMLIAGVSTVFCDFKELYYYYQQALRALSIGLEKDPQRWYYRFDDYQLEYLLAQYCKGMYWKALIPSGLFELLEYDESKGSALFDTLRAYLDSGCDVSASVESLFIHRNTLAYRLERIKKITGLDLDDPQQRMIVRLALLILDRHTQASG